MLSLAPEFPFTVSLRTLILGALVSAAVAWPARTEDAGASSVRDGAYAEDQAVRGERSFRKWCLECHVPATLRGPEFARTWSGRTAQDLFELTRTTMPTGNPGRLSRREYAELVAYLFRLNGFPAGARELPNDAESLKKIRIETNPPN